MRRTFLTSKLQAVGLAVWLACVLVIALGDRGGSGHPANPSHERSFHNLRVPLPEPAVPMRLQ